MKHFALIGENIEYSHSPAIHTAVFRELGVDADYALYSFPPRELHAWMKRLKDLDGFNVTKPYKNAVTAYLSGGHPESVNTVKVVNGFMTGHSTDGVGLLRDLRLLGFCYDSVLILGGGGAAYAAAEALMQNGATVYIHNRTRERAERIAEATGAQAIDALSKLRVGGVINCTTLGYNGENALPNDLPLDGVEWGYDMIYNPPVTPFLSSLAECGCRTANGLGMLIGQAIAADEIFLDTAFTGAQYEGLYAAARAAVVSEKA